MGAGFYFDEMLPGVKQENKERANDLRRQLEVFTYSNGLFLRVGSFGKQHSGSDSYTVELSKEKGRELRDALQAAMQYLAWER